MYNAPVQSSTAANPANLAPSQVTVVPTNAHGLPPFAARDISRYYEYPAFDIVYCDPVTWQCYYLDEPFCSTREDAELAAETLNANPAEGRLLAMVSLDGSPATH